jgi:hypothetical protein
MDADSLYNSLYYGHGVTLDGKVLDVGCHSGRFFEVLTRLGAKEVHGIDPAVTPKVYTRGVVPEHIYNSGIEDLPLSLRGTYDALTAFHMSLPGSREMAVNSLADALRRGGKIITTFAPGESISWKDFLKRKFAGRLERLKYFSPKMLENKNLLTYLEKTNNTGLIFCPSAFGLTLEETEIPVSDLDVFIGYKTK